MAGLRELYENQSLAVVQACGLIDGTRSHFEAMDLMERGVVEHEKLRLSTGWLTRYLSLFKRPGIFTAAAVSSASPASLLGSSLTYSLVNVESFSLSGGESQAQLLTHLYRGNTPLHRAARKTLWALKVMTEKAQRDSSGNPLAYQPAQDSHYPEGELGNNFKTVSQLIKMDLGLKVVTLDYGGWDTHENQAYHFLNLIDELSRSLSAFWNDVSAYQKQVKVIVMSEFGRRLKANESNGTDHGHGNLMLLLGGKIKGGQMYGKWPGLTTEQLDSGADLAVTTDYRSVLGETLGLETSSAREVFPNFELSKPLRLIT